jgi:hypothetical protein
MVSIVDLIDQVLCNYQDESVINRVRDNIRMRMSGVPLNVW